MNQILSVDNGKKDKIKNKKQKGNKEPIEASSIVKFFAIVLMVFGIFTIGTGTYAMYKNQQEAEKQPAKPVIEIENIAEDKLTLKVKNNSSINEIIYYWNEEDEIKISGNNRKNIEKEIEKPAGTNTLYVKATNTDGQETKYEEEFTRETDINIQFEAVEPNVKIKLEGKEELSYMTYRWNESEEKKIDINAKISEQQIEVLKGINTLTVTVVDKNNKSETSKKEINGVTKPIVTITTDGKEKFLIKASDEEGLKKVEFIINETEKYMLNLDGRKELDYAYPLHDGENKIEVTIYNTNDETAVFKAKLTK